MSKIFTRISILQRLTKNNTANRRNFSSLNELKESIRHNLEWVLFTRSAKVIENDLHEELTVMNYGLNESVLFLPSDDESKQILKDEIKTVVNAFEPRLKPDTLEIEIKISDRSNSIYEIDIKGHVLYEPVTAATYKAKIFQQKVSFDE